MIVNTKQKSFVVHFTKVSDMQVIVEADDESDAEALFLEDYEDYAPEAREIESIVEDVSSEALADATLEDGFVLEGED